MSSLTLLLLSHYFSTLAIRRTIHQVDARTIDFEHPGGWFDVAVLVLNPTGAALFIAGAILAGLVVFANVR